ncbi:MAG: hypothetical protein ACOX5S_02640 [Patescibacteria group bacterium]|jgi:hypothetical protein
MTFSFSCKLSCKKLFLAFFIFGTAFLLLVPKIKAVNAYYEPGTGGGVGGKVASFEEAVYETNEFNNESHSYATTENIIQSLNNMILGCATETCANALASKGLPTNGAVGAASGLIASLYATPPASSAYYLADLGQRLNLTQSVYAQGIGFSGLNPLLDLWKAARNVAYTFFIFVFLIIGFAIMFRAKINPQTVVTIQSAIPKAVVALILVTFSYAIAGLMIDLMYLSIGLLFGLIPANFKAFLPHGSDVTPYYTGGFGELIHNVWDAGWGSFWRVLTEGVGWTGLGVDAGITGIAAGIAALLSGPTGWVALATAVATPILLIFLVAIIVLFATVKIFWVLLVSYINIIISILIAPIQLMLSAIPGQNTFGPWISNLLKNILVFPATVGMFILAFILSDLSKISGDQNLWVPPLLGFWGEKTSQAIGGLLGFGIILMTPKVADIIKSMFEKKPFAAGTAIGEALGPAKGIGKAAGWVGVSSGAEAITAGWSGATQPPIKKGVRTILQRTKIVQ